MGVEGRGRGREGRRRRRRRRRSRSRRRTYVTIVPLIAGSFYEKMSLKPIAVRGYARRTCKQPRRCIPVLEAFGSLALTVCGIIDTGLKD
jgi:hypothetical protein